ncbi:hypothetical protein [Roseicyclus amphidinii]|uniref:hypothetical protein n=1 Tax=Roseicyclus amphidinii TaxID=3034232 RepID=UPI0024E125B4|nr:hypothetical protein [Roseicyclus sp. Amp-Y-6]
MLRIDVDPKEFQRLEKLFGATEDQIRKAWWRAQSRTATHLRLKARMALRKGLDLRANKYLKARLRLSGRAGSDRRLSASFLWVGLNDLPVRAFKGAPRRTASGVNAAGRSFPGAFIGTGKDSGVRIVFRRRGRKRLPIFAETVPIQETAGDILENEVMSETAEFLMRTFRNELRARTIYRRGT